MLAARLTSLWQRAHAGIDRVLAQQLLDAQQLVVFRQTIRATQAAGLDLTAVRRPGDAT